MFSPHAYECNKYIDAFFITGVLYENIKSKKNKNTKKLKNQYRYQNQNKYLDFILSSNSNLNLKPDILFTFPENKELVTNSILDVNKIKKNKI
jgi:hypothetical protein